MLLSYHTSAKLDKNRAHYNSVYERIFSILAISAGSQKDKVSHPTPRCQAKRPEEDATSMQNFKLIAKKNVSLRRGIEPRPPANCRMTSRNTDHYTI
jgi:hypothetical protein